MTRNIEKVTIYCASSDKVDPVFFEGARVIAEILVQQNIQILFGGGAKGLMGQLADTASDKGTLATFTAGAFITGGNGGGFLLAYYWKTQMRSSLYQVDPVLWKNYWKLLL